MDTRQGSRGLSGYRRFVRADFARGFIARFYRGDFDSPQPPATNCQVTVRDDSEAFAPGLLSKSVMLRHL